MCKVRVAIDTSALRRDARLSSAPMEALARSAEKGHVEILIPYVVAKEFTTTPSSKIESLAELRKTLKNLKQNLPSELHAFVAEFETRTAGEFDALEAAAKHRFDEWQARTGAIIVQPAADHAAKVMEKYFAGAPPFGSVKARTDIPDAFIVEVILDLASQDPLFAVAEDSRVADALKKAPDITVFKTIRKLLVSDEFAEALADIGVDIEAEHGQPNLQKVVAEFLRDNARFHKSMEEDVSRLVAGKTLTYRNPHYDEKDTPDELYVDSVEEVSEWMFDGSSDYLGEGVILVNFEARVEISADDPMGASWYNEELYPDYSREVKVWGAVSLKLDTADRLQHPIKSSGTQLLAAATVSIDELDDISLVPRSY
jgi:hypothetical protein